MIRRLVCWWAGHDWHYEPELLRFERSGNPFQRHSRTCRRCYERNVLRVSRYGTTWRVL